MTSNFITRMGFKGRFEDLPPLPQGEDIPNPEDIEDKWRVSLRGHFEIASMFAMEHLEKDAYILKPTLTAFSGGDTEYPYYAEWFNWITADDCEGRTGSEMVKLFVHALGILKVEDLKDDDGPAVFKKLVEAAPTAVGRVLSCQMVWSAKMKDGELKGPYFNVYQAKKSSLDKGPVEPPF